MHQAKEEGRCPRQWLTERTSTITRRSLINEYETVYKITVERRAGKASHTNAFCVTFSIILIGVPVGIADRLKRGGSQFRKQES